MLTIRTSAQIRGVRNVKGFRWCAVSTGMAIPRVDVDRILRAETNLVKSELRRRWLASRWEAHQARTAGSARPEVGEMGR